MHRTLSTHRQHSCTDSTHAQTALTHRQYLRIDITCTQTALVHRQRSRTNSNRKTDVIWSCSMRNVPMMFAVDSRSNKRFRTAEGRIKAEQGRGRADGMHANALHVQCTRFQVPNYLTLQYNTLPHCTTCMGNAVQWCKAQHNLTCLQSDRHQQHLAASSLRDGGNGGA